VDIVLLVCQNCSDVSTYLHLFLIVYLIDYFALVAILVDHSDSILLLQPTGCVVARARRVIAILELVSIAALHCNRGSRLIDRVRSETEVSDWLTEALNLVYAGTRSVGIARGHLRLSEEYWLNVVPLQTGGIELLNSLRVAKRGSTVRSTGCESPYSFVAKQLKRLPAVLMTRVISPASRVRGNTLQLGNTLGSVVRMLEIDKGHGSLTDEANVTDWAKASDNSAHQSFIGPLRKSADKNRPLELHSASRPLRLTRAASSSPRHHGCAVGSASNVVSLLLEFLDTRRRVGVAPESNHDALAGRIELHTRYQPALAIGHQELADIGFGRVRVDSVEFDDEMAHDTCSCRWSLVAVGVGVYFGIVRAGPGLCCGRGGRLALNK
jgi:hypothetical protein